jgi:hypothetical protein
VSGRAILPGAPRARGWFTGGCAGENARTGIVLLVVLVIVLWAIAIAVPIWLLVLIGHAPGEDGDRTARALAIASGGFLAFAIPATGASIGLFFTRRWSRRAEPGTPPS